MANIQKYLDDIKKALFGREVRGSIHDAIEAINKETERTTASQEHLDSTFKQLIINAGQSNAEVVDARVEADGTTHATLGDRLDNLDSKFGITNKEVVDARTDKNGTIHKDLKTRLDNVDSQLEHEKKKIFDLGINILDFKEHVIDDDYGIAIQKAIDLANTYYFNTGGNAEGLYSRAISTPKIIIPSGSYEIKSTINIGTSLNIEGIGKPILKGVNMDDKALFKSTQGQDGMPPAVKVNIENICACNFKYFVDFDNNGQESTKHNYNNLDIKTCEYAFKVELDSSIFTVSNSTIELCKYVYVGNSDNAKFENCWIVQGFLTTNGDATFKPTYNRSTRGKLVLENICGIPMNSAIRYPSLGGPLLGVSETAWVNIEHNMELHIKNFRGGGELGGQTLVNWKAPFITNGQSSSKYPSVLIIEGSQGQDSIRTDLDPSDNPNNQCSVRLYSIPNIFVYKNNFGGNQSKYLVGVPDNWTKQDLYVYSKLASENDTGYLESTSPNSIFWEIENNTMRLQGNQNNIVHPMLKEFVGLRQNIKLNFDKTSNEYQFDTLSKKIIVDLKSPKFNLEKINGIYSDFIGIYDINYKVSSSSSSLTRFMYGYLLKVNYFYDNSDRKYKYNISIDKKYNMDGDTRPTNHCIISDCKLIKSDDSLHDELGDGIKGVRLFIDTSWTTNEPLDFEMTINKIN